MSRRREEQDILDKVILGALKRGPVRWTALEKKVLTTCYSLLRGQDLMIVYVTCSRKSILSGLAEESTGLQRMEQNTWK